MVGTTFFVLYGILGETNKGLGKAQKAARGRSMKARPTLSVPYFTSIRKESSGPLSIIRWLWDEISTN